MRTSWTKKTHLVGFSVDEAKDNPLNITEEEAYLLGRYVADGYIRDGKRAGRKNSYNAQVIFAIGMDKLNEFLSEVKTFNVGWTQEGKVAKCRIINKDFKNLCSEFGRGAHNKRIHEGIYQSNQELQKSFLKGYWSGDGSISKNVHKATTVSKELAYGLVRLVQQSYEVPCTMTFTKRPRTTVIEGRTVNQRDAWEVSFRLNATVRQSYKAHGMIWNPVREKEYDEDFEGFVYNMEVEGDNSYTANNMAVHNCQTFSVAGKRAGMAYVCRDCEHEQTISFNQYADRDFVCESCGGVVEAVDGRGLLFFEVARVARDKQPKVVLLENVKGLVGHDKGRTLDTIVRTLSEIGYVVDFDVLNSKFYGVPQNRERIFVVAVREDIQPHEPWTEESRKGQTVIPKGKRRIFEYDEVKTFNFDFPTNNKVTAILRDVLEESVDEKYYLDDEKTATLIEELEFNVKEGQGGIVYNRKEGVKTELEIAKTLPASDWRGLNRNQDQTAVIESLPMNCEIPQDPNMLGLLDMKGNESIRRVYDPNACGPTLTTMGGGHREPKVVDNSTETRIRKLTPKECWRLQGFTDEQHDAVEQAGVSNSQRYKQAGNAVTVNVIEAIGEKLLPYLRKGAI